jgi:hypothetical protein
LIPTEIPKIVQNLFKLARVERSWRLQLRPLCV